MTATGASTPKQLGCTPLTAGKDSPLMLPGPLVKAAGLAAQLALFCPATLVTCTVTVQADGPAGTLTLLIVMALPPAGAEVAAALLAQVPPTLAGLATRRPVGSVSTKEIDEAAAVFDAVNVKLSVVVPPSAMLPLLNDLVSNGLTTASVAVSWLLAVLSKVNAARLAITSMLTTVVCGEGVTNNPV